MSLAAWMPSSLRFFSICLLRAIAARSSAEEVHPMVRAASMQNVTAAFWDSHSLIHRPSGHPPPSTVTSTSTPRAQLSVFNSIELNSAIARSRYTLLTDASAFLVTQFGRSVDFGRLLTPPDCTEALQSRAASSPDKWTCAVARFRAPQRLYACVARRPRWTFTHPPLHAPATFAAKPRTTFEQAIP